MDCQKLLEQNFPMIQTGLLVIVVFGLLYMSMMTIPKKAAFSEHAVGLPSPALGLGTSNVMGFYQGFDQLWGSGSSSYSAPDSDYRKLMHGNDLDNQEMNF